MNDNYYETSDLGLAAALLTSGITLVRVNKDNPRRAVFIFIDSDSTNSMVDAYWSGTLQIDALRYFENTKRLKSRIYGD